MTEETALVPHNEQFVDFYGDRINLVLIDDEPYVPLRPINDFIGLAWGSQRQRTLRDNAMAHRVKNLTVTASDGRQREMMCLPLDLLPGWLFGITVSRVKEELKEKLDKYRGECFKALWQAFQEGRLTADPNLDELLASDSPAAQTYQILQAMTQLARNQVLMEARITGELQEQGQRIEAIEAQLGDPKRHITADQATNISQAVKVIARQLSKVSGRNEYGGVYGEMYRRFEIPSYRDLPAKRYDEVMKWLRDWWQELTSTDIPF